MNRSGNVPLHTDFEELGPVKNALQQSEAKLRAILETAVEGIITINKNGIIESINRAALRIFRYKSDEVIGQNIKLLTPSPYREEHDGYLSSYLRTGERKIIGIGREVVGERSDGSTFPMYLSVAEMLLDGGPHFTGIVRDLTEAKTAQERLLQSERLAAIGQMVTALSHESRNYLQRISSSAEMLEVEVEGNAEAIKDVANVLKATQSLNELLEEVRSFAAPIKLDVSTCCVASIWRRVWSELEPSWRDREIAFLEEKNTVDTNCTVDVFRLEQVFRNLFENSLVACGDPMRIVIRCADSKIGAAPALQISICDNGPGLTKEQKERVFDAFFTTKTKGTGLGMSIVKRLVEAHGGQIIVGDNAAAGAEFAITIPR